MNFEKAFNKGTRAYGFTMTELPILADHSRYTALSPDDEGSLVKWISPSGSVVCLGQDATVMTVLLESPDLKGSTRRLCYKNTAYSRADRNYLHPASAQNRSAQELGSGIHQKPQWGMEVLGEELGLADAEVLAAALTILKEAGMPQKTLRLEIGDARLSKWLLEQLGVKSADQKQIQRWLDEKNLSELKKAGYAAVADLAGAFGDFDRVFEEVCGSWFQRGWKLPAQMFELAQFRHLLGRYDFGEVQIQGDFGTTNRYHYYSSLMYRIYSVQSGKMIAAGGRYDNIDGKGLRGCGLSFYEENIMEVLKMNRVKKKSLWAACEADYTVVCSGGNDKEGIALAQSLRAMGYSVVVQAKSELLETRRLVLVEKDRVQVMDSMKNDVYQGDIETFKKREEARRYAGSIH